MVSFVSCMVCCALICVISSSAIILMGNSSWLLYFVCLPGVFDCYCSEALPHGAVGWSAVCDCAIS